MSCCAVVIPIKGRSQELSEKIEESLQVKIREISRKMAEGILRDPKLENITKVIEAFRLSIIHEVNCTVLQKFAKYINVKLYGSFFVRVY